MKAERESFVSAEGLTCSQVSLWRECFQTRSPAVVTDSHLSSIYTPVHLHVPPLFYSSSGMSDSTPSPETSYLLLHPHFNLFYMHNSSEDWFDKSKNKDMDETYLKVRLFSSKIEQNG